MTTETFKLSRPLKTHSGEVTELTLHTVKCREYVKRNDPFKTKIIRDANGVGKDIEFEFTDNQAMLGLLTSMIEPRVDDILLSDIESYDYLALRNRAAWIIAFGFGDQNPSKLSAE